MSLRYKKMLLYYFTGTGNAKTAAAWVAQEAKNAGMDVDVFNMEKVNPREITSPDQSTVVGVFYPTHGFNAPPVVLDFLKNFPRAKNVNVFFVNTRAGMKIRKWNTPGVSGIAQYLPAFMLRIKGYRAVGWRPLDLPSNWISIHPALQGTAVDFIFEKCKKVIISFTKKIIEGKKVHRGLCDFPLDIAVSPIAFLYFIYGRFTLAKTFVASSICDNCGLCIKKCPLNAIKKIKGRLYWSFKCESCMRCMNNCSKNAIETPHVTTGFIWWIAFSIVPFYLTKYLLEGHIYKYMESSELIDRAFELITAGIGIFCLYLSYWILHFLMKLKFFNKLVVWTSLTHLPFWGRYKAPKKYSTFLDKR